MNDDDYFTAPRKFTDYFFSYTEILLRKIKIRKVISFSIETLRSILEV